MSKKLKNLAITVASLFILSSPAYAKNIRENHSLQIKDNYTLRVREREPLNLRFPVKEIKKREFSPRKIVGPIKEEIKRPVKQINRDKPPVAFDNKRLPKYSTDRSNTFEILRNNLQRKGRDTYLKLGKKQSWGLEKILLHSRVGWRSSRLGLKVDYLKHNYVDIGFSRGKEPYHTWGTYTSARYGRFFLNFEYFGATHYRHKEGYNFKLSASINSYFISINAGVTPWDKFYDNHVAKHKLWGRKNITAGASLFFRFDENNLFYNPIKKRKK